MGSARSSARCRGLAGGVIGAGKDTSSAATSGTSADPSGTCSVTSVADKVIPSVVINPGNSGGALANCDGQLVGVPTAGASVPSSSGEAPGGNIGLGFAVPVAVARTISNEIIATGRATHAYFGQQSTPISAESAAQAGVPQGLFVAGVTADGPAATAGLRQGDVITMVNGQAVTSNIQLQELTLTKKAGDKVQIGHTRDGNANTATVTLGMQP
jgi:putative serine protease PepD